MRGILTAGLVLIAAVFAALPAQAQTEEEAELAVRKEMVWTFVRSGDSSAESLAQMAEQSVLDALDTEGGKLPADVKTWMATAFTAVAQKVTTDITPDIKQQLFDAYFERFTVEDMKKILAFQEFVREPARAALIAESDTAATPKEKFAILKQRLPPEEFSYLIQTTLTPPMLDMTMATMGVSKTIAADYMKRFNKEVVTHCASAPKGVAMCEKQGKRP